MPRIPPTAPAPITVALEEACISTRGVLAATLEIDSFDAAGTGATPPKAEAGVVPIRVSLNGQQFFETGLDFQYYAHPTLSSIYPAGGVTFRVSSVLLAQSDVFRGMLTNGLQEAAQRRIELPDMSADCWRALYARIRTSRR